MRARFFLVAPILALVACSAGESKDEGFPANEQDATANEDALAVDGSSSDGWTVPADVAPPCVGLECQQKACAGDAKTTVTGTVYDPAGRVPLYNVIVYVPNAPLEPFPKGVSCDKCGTIASGSPLVTALTDEKGNFTLTNVPVGKDIPLVMQVGKWRRQIVIPEVKECVDNPLTDKDQTRLPRSRAEGDLPHIAVTTGSADELECFLREIGIDDSEFTGRDGDGAVHLYKGQGGATMAGVTGAQEFWSNLDELKKYDIVILSCEGAEYGSTKPMAAREALKAYTEAGGRVFASHFHYYWFKNGPADFQSTATWSGGGTANPYLIDMSFPKGKAFAEWLVNVGASTTLGQISLSDVKNDVGTVNPAVSTRWVYENTGAESVKYFSFNTPVGAEPENQCGRAVFSDIHISNTSGGGTFPKDCATSGGFSAQEKALEFLLFDLSSCIQPSGDPPKPPPPK